MNFLKASTGFVNNTYKFYPSDDEKLFNTNKKKFGTEWEFYNKQIFYKVNSLGYREQEFEKINWNSSVVCLGCSHTFGIGLPEEETYVRKLQNTINHQCVNLGIPGGSMSAILHNILVLKHLNVQPWKIVIQVPDLARNYYAIKTDHGLNIMHVIPHLQGLITKENLVYYSRENLKHFFDQTKSIIEYLFPATNIVWFTACHPSDAKNLNIPMPKEFNITSFENLHWARDRMHFGQTIQNSIVDFILEEL